MLIEAKDQVGYGAWGRWLTKNFDLSHRQANEYMRWAREHNHFSGGDAKVSSLRLATTVSPLVSAAVAYH